MDDGLLMKTCFLTGRATRVSRDSVSAVARAPVRVAAWIRLRVGLLNPFNWRRKAGLEPNRNGDARFSSAVFAGAREKLVSSRALEDLTRQDETMRLRGVRALGGIRHELSVEALSAHLSREPSAEVRKECVKALTELGMKEGLPAVERALSDTSGSVRLVAVRGVYRLAGPESASSLIRMFSDEHEEVRRRAAACTGWLGEERLAVELLPLLKDGSAFVRRTALDALANLKSSDAAAEAIQLLNDPEESVRKKAFNVLRTITGKQMEKAFPKDAPERQLLIARWRTWEERQSSRWES